MDKKYSKWLSLVLTGAVWALLCFSSIHAATTNVPADQPTIKAGIDAAKSGDTVLVADGVYSGAGNRDISLSGKQLVIVSESGPEATIIDCGGSQSEPHRGFLFDSGEDSTTILRGFTIQNGYGSAGGPRGELVGGGILIRSSSPTIENCILRGNKANHGAGLFCQTSSSLIRSCVFDGDTAETFPTLGGGASLTGNSSVEFSNCVFRNNWSSSGGGIYCDSSFVELINCAFDTNWAAG
ncbi:MAG: right-handed parallel beta-helix repeat-containing protein, partial [Candidatus Zixiibacteriota bacterium]